MVEAALATTAIPGTANADEEGVGLFGVGTAFGVVVGDEVGEGFADALALGVGGAFTTVTVNLELVPMGVSPIIESFPSFTVPTYCCR